MITDKEYGVFAREVIPVIRNWKDANKTIKDNYQVSIKGILTYPDEAAIKESSLLKRHKGNPLILNSSLKSTYATDKTSK